jgi:hypothetical protein
MVTAIGNTNTKLNTGIKPKVRIFDARPYLSAQANKMKGGGFEDIRNYPNCQIVFCDI